MPFVPHNEPIPELFASMSRVDPTSSWGLKPQFKVKSDQKRRLRPKSSRPTPIHFLTSDLAITFSNIGGTSPQSFAGLRPRHPGRFLRAETQTTNRLGARPLLGPKPRIGGESDSLERWLSLILRGPLLTCSATLGCQTVVPGQFSHFRPFGSPRPLHTQRFRA